MPQITGLAITPLTYVIANLRPEDRLEIEAVRGRPLDPERMAMELSRMTILGDGWLFWNRRSGAPIAALGAYAMTPSCASCWAFGTEEWPYIVKSVTRHIRTIMIPRLLTAGFHRAECRALASREDTRRWLTGFGWRAEAVLSEFGIRREDFTLFAWLAADDEHSDHVREPTGQGELPLR